MVEDSKVDRKTTTTKKVVTSNFLNFSFLVNAMLRNEKLYSMKLQHIGWGNMKLYRSQELLQVIF